jgi:1-acyl-sn-glycerol-3-phosphate acyltransferase
MLVLLFYKTHYAVYIRINETPAFYSLRFFLFYSFLLSKFVLEQRNYSKCLIFRDFIIRILNFLLGIRLYIYGNAPVVQGLIVANHRSYFDPILC